jgi:hypothetical protein
VTNILRPLQRGVARLEKTPESGAVETDQARCVSCDWRGDDPVFLLTAVRDGAIQTRKFGDQTESPAHRKRAMLIFFVNS